MWIRSVVYRYVDILQLWSFVRGSRKGVAANRHVENADQRGVSRVLVQRRVQARQVQEVRRSVQQRPAPDVGRLEHAVLEAGRTAVFRRHERPEGHEPQQQAATAGQGGLPDDAPRRGLPRARRHSDAGGFRTVYGPRFHPHGHAVRLVVAFPRGFLVGFLAEKDDSIRNCSFWPRRK